MNLDDPAPTSSEPIVGSFIAEVGKARGKVVGTWNDGGLLTSAETRGVRHVLGWSPSATEHHFRAPFSLRASVMLTRSGWTSPDAELTALLDARAEAMRRFLSWDGLGGGPTWAVQARSIGGPEAHLVVRAGDYAGRAGFAEALEVLEALIHVLPPGGFPIGPLLAPTEFAGRACKALGVGAAR